MTKIGTPLYALPLLALLSACADPFDPGSLLSDTRVLGARVELVDDAETSSPAAGEQVHITWLTRDPHGEPSLRWSFVACLAVTEGELPCTGGPLDTFTGEGPVSAFDLTVPDLASLGAARSLTLLGMICDEGPVSIASDGTPTCEGHGTSVSLDLPIAFEAERNHNPELTDAALSIDGLPLGAAGAGSDASACRDDTSITQLTADGKEHDFAFTVGAAARERYRDAEGLRDVLEELQISQFVTAGELASQFQFVEPEVPLVRTTREQKWTAPKAKDTAQAGELVRFVTVVRDLRGGLAFREYFACLHP